MAQAQGANADAFRQRPEVQRLVNVSQQYSAAGTQIAAESELLITSLTDLRFPLCAWVRAWPVPSSMNAAVAVMRPLDWLPRSRA